MFGNYNLTNAASSAIEYIQRGIDHALSFGSGNRYRAFTPTPQASALSSLQPDIRSVVDQPKALGSVELLPEELKSNIARFLQSEDVGSLQLASH